LLHLLQIGISKSIVRTHHTAMPVAVLAQAKCMGQWPSFACTSNEPSQLTGNPNAADSNHLSAPLFPVMDPKATGTPQELAAGTPKAPATDSKAASLPPNAGLPFQTTFSPITGMTERTHSLQAQWSQPPSQRNATSVGKPLGPRWDHTVCASQDSRTLCGTSQHSYFFDSGCPATNGS
jgi:hypothetical protein